MNIFYSEIDKNLQTELNERGRTGFTNRTNRAIDFMAGKIANVQLTAYEGNDSKSPLATLYPILGGAQMQSGRYMPNGDDGFLTDTVYTKDSINFYTERDVQANSANKDVIVGNAYTSTTAYTDRTKRLGPYIVNVNVDIGDHSMGLLNKATVDFAIPNPDRDLDGIEETWFRPGRYVKIQIVHPNSAIVSKLETDGLLTEKTLPNRDRIKELYPNWNVDDLLNDIAQMNVFTFEGLITSFDFSYNTDAAIDATISLTGTSNVYTDVSMYTSTPKTKEDNPKKDPKIVTNPIIGPTYETTVTPPATASFAARSEFYDQLYNRVETLIANFCGTISNGNVTQAAAIKTNNQFIIPFNVPNAAANNPTDHFILAGQQYLPKIQESDIAEPTDVYKFDPNSILTDAAQLAQFSASLQEKQDKRRNLIDSFNNSVQTNYNRYITLGGLIHFLNTYVVTKITGSVQGAEIICTDALCFSNYYPSLVSAVPDDVLFLPKDPTIPGDMNYYGKLENSLASLASALAGIDNLHYYNKVNSLTTELGINEQTLTAAGWKPWPGVYDGTSTSGRIFPTRIFLNLEMIESILNSLSEKNTKSFSIKTLLTTISSKISYASGKAIDMKLVSYPDDPNKLLFTDTKYLKSIDKLGSVENITPYSVPMFANHINGSIVREFTFSAKLPDNVKNLSYVLNQGDDVTEESIAPYMNFMYNAKDPNKINEMIGKYKDRHEQIILQLLETKIKYGLSPGVPTNQQALYKALTDYIKYPTNDIRKSQQITAPIFPFDVTITIDGINGLRYGDVLTFEALPLKYRINTVFSIIGITHAVSSYGEWTTQIKCIMRPSID
jgi:hypothetical protein